LTASPLDSMGPPCIQGDVRQVKEGDVRHYLPGENPFVNEHTKDYHIPGGSGDRRSRDDVSRGSEENKGQVHRS
jgi:hypothetical protein